MLENYLLCGAVLVASLGGVSDLRSARIPNWLSYGGALAALVLRASLLGWSGFKNGVVGFLAAGVFFLVLFIIGAMGGGDVKLMASVGAWAGSSHVLSVLLAAAMAGGVLAIFHMLFGRGVRATFWSLFELIRFRFTAGFSPHPVLNIQQGNRLHVPFGVAIALGTLFCAGNAILWR